MGHFSFLTNQKKAIKNTFVTIGIPFLIWLADNYLQIIPNEYKNFFTLSITGYISYSIKNYLENKNA